MKNINDIIAQQQYVSENMIKRDHFDKGVLKAMQAAKESVRMNNDQSDKAIRKSLISFANSMHSMPKAKGFMNNVAQAGRAMGPALETYDESELQSEAENQRALQYAQQLQAQEGARAANLEQQAYLREHAANELEHKQDQLEEQRSFHNNSNEAAMLKAQGGGTEGTHAKHLIKANVQDLKEQKKSANLAKIRYDVLKDYSNTLEKAKLKGLTGTDIFPEIRRQYARHVSGNSEELTLNDMLKQAYISRTKELGGSNPSTQEVNLAFATIPGIEKHYEASLTQLNRDIEESLDIINKYNNFNEKMETTGFLGMPDKITHAKKTDANINNNAFVETLPLINNEGEIINIQISDKQALLIAKQKGYKPVNTPTITSDNGKSKNKSIFDVFRNVNLKKMLER